MPTIYPTRLVTLTQLKYWNIESVACIRDELKVAAALKPFNKLLRFIFIFSKFKPKKKLNVIKLASVFPNANGLCRK